MRATQQVRLAERALAAAGDRLATFRFRLASTPPIPDRKRREAIATWLGPRLWWSRDRHPRRPIVGVVSSRTGRPSRKLAPWLLALRSVCEHLDASRERLMCVPETTTCDWLERCRGLFGVPLLRVEVLCNDNRLRHWAGRTPAANREWRRQGDDTWCVLPDPDSRSSDTANDTRSERSCPIELAAPIRDRVAIACADRVVVLGLRRQGNLWKLLQIRLRDPSWPASSVQFVEGSGFVPRDLQRELLAMGACPWQPGGKRNQGTDLETVAPPPRPIDSAAWETGEWERGAWEPGPAPPSDDGWLTHCTRASRGHWPDQSDDEFLDDWLLHPTTADYCAEAALRRILRQGRLRAGAQAIRGGTRVVSFTAVPPDQLSSLRVYRRHRSRWDFEPFGLSIRRDWLVRRGAGPVHYGDDRSWQQMTAADRPFFQRRTSPARSGRPDIDWSLEREWRHIGDLLLEELPTDQARVLVSSPAAARRMAAWSRWPIVVLQSPENAK